MPITLKQSARPDLPAKIADSDANFWDVHLIHHPQAEWAKGWAVQVGYSAISYDIDYAPSDRPPPPLLGSVSSRRTGQTFKSPNVWITWTRPVVGRGRGSAKPGGSYVWISAGYSTSSQFDHETNLLLGASVALSRRLSLDGSVWLNNLESINTRLTAGFVGRL